MTPHALPIRPVNTSGLQQPITLQSPGNMVVVGAPGGPVVFSPYGGFVLSVLSGSAGRN